MFERFASKADTDGVLDWEAFHEVFTDLAGWKSSSERSDDVSKFDFVVSKLFAIFDSDRNGVVDFSELATGISILCGGSRDEKVEAAFSLYDYNNDGFISLAEMSKYLSSVFKVSSLLSNIIR